MEPGPHAAELAASVAGEFNDELTMLLNELNFTQEFLERGHPARARLVAARHAALRCTAIAASLLEYTRRSGMAGPVRPLGRLLAHGRGNKL